MSYEADVLDNLSRNFIQHAAFVFNVYFHEMGPQERAQWRSEEITRESSSLTRNEYFGAKLHLAETLEANPALAHKVEHELRDHHMLLAQDYGPELSGDHGWSVRENPFEVEQKILNNLTGNSMGAIAQGVCSLLYPDHKEALEAAEPWVSVSETLMLHGEALEAHEHTHQVVTGEANFNEHPSIPGITSYRDVAPSGEPTGRGEQHHEGGIGAAGDNTVEHRYDGGMNVQGDGRGGQTHDGGMSVQGDGIGGPTHDGGMSVQGDGSGGQSHDGGMCVPADGVSEKSHDDGMIVPGETHHTHQGGHHTQHDREMVVPGDAPHHAQRGGGHHAQQDNGMGVPNDVHHPQQGGHHSQQDNGMVVPDDAHHHQGAHHQHHHDAGMGVAGDHGGNQGQGAGAHTPDLTHQHVAPDGSDMTHQGG